MTKASTGFSGYARANVAARAAIDAELTQVGPGTPGGEYLRRFWHPVALSSEIKDLPRAISILGENLVVFRDLSGRAGLLHLHCSHRRASLEYGIIAERGIRCCYHGWLYDIDGRILETPGEPPTSTIMERLRHGAYPAREYKGLVFAYLGPPEAMPPFPIYDTTEMPDDELVPYAIDYPCNWLQVNENPMDPIHSVFLHTRVTRAHFNPAWGVMPTVEWHRMPDGTGVYLTNTRVWNDFVWIRTAEWIAPNFAQPPDIYQDPDREKFFVRVAITKWTVPVDDTRTRIIAWRHFNTTLDLGAKGDRAKVGQDKVDFIGQSGTERSHEEAQRLPGDYEAQVGQGPVTVHALEWLGETDRGVALSRRMIREGIRAVKAGQAPPAPTLNADGLVPTNAGDVIVRLAAASAGDDELRRRLGRAVGEIVVGTMKLGRVARQTEVERRVKALLGDLGAVRAASVG